MKRFANYILVCFVLCWAHCSMCQYLAACMEPECALSSAHATASVPCPDAGGECKLCDLLRDGTTLASRFHLEAPVFAIVSVHAPVPPPALLEDQASAGAAAHAPPRLLRICEFLSRTACPVRGPSVS